VANDPIEVNAPVSSLALDLRHTHRHGDRKPGQPAVQRHAQGGTHDRGDAFRRCTAAYDRMMSGEARFRVVLGLQTQQPMGGE